MNRQITLTVGAAAGGMLATAFLQTGVASAAVGADGGAAANPDSATGLSGLTPTGDAATGAVGDAGGVSPAADAPPTADFATDPFGLTPTGDAELTPGAGVPPFFESASGTQTFDFDSNDIAPFLQNVLNLPTGDDAVTAEDVPLNVSNMEAFGIENQGITLPEDLTLGDQTLGAGSLFDVTNFGGGFGNVYADLVGVGEGDTDQVVDYLITPFGNFNISNLVDPFDLSSLTGLDPSAGLFDLGGTGTDVGGTAAGAAADAGAAAGDAGAAAGAAGADTGADLASSLLG